MATQFPRLMEKVAAGLSPSPRANQVPRTVLGGKTSKVQYAKTFPTPLQRAQAKPGYKLKRKLTQLLSRLR